MFQGENVQLGLVYSINMTSYKLWVSIPDLYPKIAPTIMITTKECNDKDFQLELEKVVTEIVSLGFESFFKISEYLKIKNAIHRVLVIL